LKPIDVSDVLNLYEYEKRRPAMRDHVI